MLRAADPIWKTDTGRQRRENEDSVYVRVPLFVVADGMGGAQAGEVASALAVEEFRRGLPDSSPERPTPESRLAERVKSANRRIYETAQGHPEHSGMGTTLTAVLLDGDELSIAHVGDSRAYLFRDDELRRLTDDHSLVEELMRRGKLTPEQAAEHPQRSIITRALGIEPEVDVDTWTFPGRDGDVVLLCSDGLTSMIEESQIAAVLSSARSGSGEPDLDRAGERLIAAANAAGGRDNITVVLFRLEELDVPPARAPQETTAMAPVSATSDGDPNRGGVAVAPPLVEARPASGARPLRLARTQGPPGRLGSEPDPRSGRGTSRRFKLAAGLLSAFIVLFFFGAGGYLATRQLFFIGTNAQGIVTLYEGLPYDFIVPFWESTYTSGLPASALTPTERATLLNHDLRSQNDAVARIRVAEREGSGAGGSTGG